MASASAARGTEVYVLEAPKGGRKIAPSLDAEAASCLSQCWRRADGALLQAARGGDELNFQQISAFLRDGLNPPPTRAASLFAQETASLPAALVLAGVNVADHQRTFESMTARLRAAMPAARVACVGSAEARTAHELVQQIVAQISAGDVRAEAELRGVGSVVALERWLAPGVAVGGGGGGGSGGSADQAQWVAPGTQGPELVVILQDCEAFSNTVVQDVISVLASSRLRFGLVLGFATSTEVVASLLGRRAALLSSKKFTLCAAKKTLNTVVDTLLLGDGQLRGEVPGDDCPVAVPLPALGIRVLEALTTNFLTWNFTIEATIQNISFAYNQHFHDQPLAPLCRFVSGLSEAEQGTGGGVSSPGHDDSSGGGVSPGHMDGARAAVAELRRAGSRGETALRDIRETPSVMHFLEHSCTARERGKLSSDDEAMAEKAAEWALALRKHFCRLPALLRCLHAAVRAARLLSKAQLESARYTYAALLEEGGGAAEFAEKLRRQLERNLKPDEQAKVLRDCRAHLLGHCAIATADAECLEWASKLEGLAAALGAAGEEDDEGEEEAEDERAREQREAREKEMDAWNRKKLRRHKLSAASAQGTRKASKAASAAGQAIDWIVGLIAQLSLERIRGIREYPVPLMEAVTFQNCRELEEKRMPRIHPREATIAALCEPQAYFPAALSSDLWQHDSGVLYQLLRERGESTKASELRAAFEKRVSAAARGEVPKSATPRKGGDAVEDGKGKGAKGGGKAAAQPKQAARGQKRGRGGGDAAIAERFRYALSELRVLGFVRADSRRSEHYVAKLPLAFTDM